MHVRSSAPAPAAPFVPSFTVGVDVDGDRARLTPRGELDLVTVAPLERAVAQVCEQGVADVVLDLSELTFFDSSALCLLLRLDARLHDQRRGFGIVTGDGIAARVLSITRMRGRFRCDDPEPSRAEIAEQLPRGDASPSRRQLSCRAHGDAIGTSK